MPEVKIKLERKYEYTTLGIQKRDIVTGTNEEQYIL